RSLRQAAKASGLHPDIRRFESVREHHSNSKHASSVRDARARPITAWKSIFRKSGYRFSVRKMRQQKKWGQYLPLAPMRTRNLKPKWRGSGLLTRRPVDRNHSRPPLHGPVTVAAERGGLLIRRLLPIAGSNPAWSSK